MNEQGVLIIMIIAHVQESDSGMSLEMNFVKFC